MTTNVLILCTHNSARSVLGEGMLNHWAARLGKDVRAYSAGSAPSGRVNPFALEVLADAGVDTAGHHSKSWDEFVAADAPRMRRACASSLPCATQRQLSSARIGRAARSRRIGAIRTRRMCPSPAGKRHST
jgi:protein-tyrosine-phosphatase